MKKLLLSLSIIILIAKGALAQSHGHLYIGATNTAQGTPLIFDNASDYSTNTGYIKTLTYTNGAQYAGYYQGNITLTGLAATAAFSGPELNAAALGSQLWAQIVSVEGPAGGAFGFWEVNATTPTISLACGTTGTNAFKVTQTAGAPGDDPFGHIHGRRFTATKPGSYLVGFRALDRTTNGINSGPIHTPSEVLKFYFQAGINIAAISRTNGMADVTFGSAIGQTFYLEYSTDLSSDIWTTLGSVAGNDALQILSDPAANSISRFYHIKVTTP
ncbi:MAG: hypothetical protein JWQ71_2443 [Pedosphaera sp.]|nr:hypothetical protein [Pedosphaera sp.]